MVHGMILIATVQLRYYQAIANEAGSHFGVPIFVIGSCVEGKGDFGRLLGDRIEC